MSDTPMKRCNKCEEWKPATHDFFPADKGRKDGLKSQCKMCVNAASAAWRAANPEKQAAASAAWEAANKERRSATKAAWEAANKERRSATKAAWRAANKERRSATNAAWRAANAEKRRVYKHKRKARKRQLPFFWNADMERAMHDYWQGRCAYCDKPLDGSFHLDHYIPLAAGWLCPGSVRWNYVPSCGTCNDSKGASWPETWLKRRFGAQAEAIQARIEDYFRLVAPSPREKRAARRRAKQMELFG